MKTLEIWTNRWNKYARACLIGAWRVREPGEYEIVLTESPNEPHYYMYDHEIKRYPIEKKKSKAGVWNEFYAVPVEECRKHTTPFNKRFREISTEEFDNLIKTGKL